jgi:hypothetical protein
MVKIVPPQPRFHVADRGEELEIRIPGRRNPWVIAFIVFFIGMILMAVLSMALENPGQAAAPPVPQAQPQRVPPWPLVVWIIMFIVFWVGFVGYFVLQALAASESIVVSENSLRLKRGPWGWGRCREFDPSHVRNLRYAPDQAGPWPRNGFWFAERPSVAFDYGARTFRFGYDLDEPESELLIAVLDERLAKAGNHDS